MLYARGGGGADEDSGAVSIAIRPDDAAPAGPQPIPLDTVVLHGDSHTYVSRFWRDRDDAIRNCTLCPKSACLVSPEGMCLVEIRGFVPTALAPLRPTLSPGLGRSALVALRLDGSGS